MDGTRIYVDTSVLGGCFDVEFSPWSNGLVEDFRRGVFRAVLSDVTAEEIGRAPAVQLFNEVNVGLGRGALTIYSPGEVTTYGRDQRDSDN